ncbi:MAG: serine/threonine-protein phosphatase [Prevotella sp.]|nr:serine/threonine-protein phosphatase [Prevotella sp.]
MKFSITAASMLGCVRENNEDMILVHDRYVRNGEYWTMVDIDTKDRYLIALADGMGGHNSGEVASSETLHNLQYYFSDLPVCLNPGDFNEAVFGWLESINAIIESQGYVEAKYHEMGTTLVSLVYFSGEFYWMNCGDSRIYRLHEGNLTQMSTDHSYRNLLGVAGYDSVITNCIGGGCKTSFIDIVKCTAEVLPEDVLLLCSDGLTDMLTDAQIVELLQSGADASALCKAAEEVGGFDNVSACVIKVVE